MSSHPFCDKSFVDHYMELQFELSEGVFIAAGGDTEATAIAPLTCLPIKVRTRDAPVGLEIRWCDVSDAPRGPCSD